MKSIILLISLLLTGTAFAQTASPQVSYEITSPNWASSAAWDGYRISIGSYPASSEFGGGVVQANVGAVDIPSTSTVGQAMGIAGYALTSSQTTWAVGTLGFAGLTANTTAGAEAGQLVGTNCNAQGCATSTGYNFSNLIVSEHDINLMKTSGGAQPTGSVYGEITIGASETQPTGDFQAYRIDPPGVVHSPIIPWKEGIHISNGAATNSINIGTQTVSNSPDISSPIYLHDRNASGADQTSVVIADPNGNIALMPASGEVDIQGWDLRIRLAQSPPSTCLVGQIQWDSAAIYVCVSANTWKHAALIP